MDEDYLMFVVEYKVKGELFVKKFAYESKCIDAIDGLLYINTLDGAELTINRNFLEYRIERPLKNNETFE